MVFTQMKRYAKRLMDQIRPLNITKDICEYAGGSVLFEMGKTKVLCGVTIQPGVPPFLKGRGVGWLTAEYAMLPISTAQRTIREVNNLKRNERSVEISRLIGRVLRAVTNLQALGERTIVVDCDVIQADGGTRTACINGAFLALALAEQKWSFNKIIESPFIKDTIAAVSAGIVQDQVLVDLDWSEDSQAKADFNFVVTKSGKLIEIQGGAEGSSLEWETFDTMKSAIQHSVQTLFNFFDTHLHGVAHESNSGMKEKTPLFSLNSRKNSLMNAHGNS